MLAGRVDYKNKSFMDDDRMLEKVKRRIKKKNPSEPGDFDRQR